jgi:hypothetical protein
LIARQRACLNRTFVHEQAVPIPPEVTRRLSTFQEELTAATDRFSAGIRQVGEGVGPLDEAVTAMRGASRALGERRLAAARPHQESALAALIRARRNLRKLLSQSNAQQAGACRSFDRRQHQDIRRPPEDETKRRLARLENDLRALSQEERAFSEAIDPRARSDSTTEPSRPDPATRQRQAVREAERLRDLARRDEALAERTRRGIEQAKQTVGESARQIEAGNPVESAAQARAAAEQLQRLARQVGAQKAREPAERLARTRDLIQGLSSDQRALGPDLKGPAGESAPRWAERQRNLAEEVAALADLMDRLRSDAAEEDPTLARSVDQAARSHPPRDVEAAMRQGAAAAEVGRRAEARRVTEAAARRLDALAQDLESARRGLAQPVLDRFLATEKQAARVQELLGSVRTGNQRGAAERALAELAHQVDGLATSDGPLRHAADRLNRALRPGASYTWRRNETQIPDRAALLLPPMEYADSIRAVAVALQARIQQLVLDRALMERDQAVPPRYKAMVEDYYRILSQDLR